MTESEWADSADLTLMLKLLRGKTSDRKLRLFACEACRHFCGLVRQLFPNQPWLLPDYPEVWRAFGVAEQFAEGLTDQADLALAQETAERLATSKHWLEYALLSTTRSSAWDAADQATLGLGEFIGHRLPPADESIQPGLAARLDDQTYEAGLIRCSFGPLPFRSVTFDPSWLTDTVKRLAAAIYDERDFNSLPILADALEEAGCTNTEILNHCRQPGDHLRGCWPVDLILGKQ
jgi:hypothetical protein